MSSSKDFITWNKEYEISTPEINSQHKEFIVILNKIAKSCIGHVDQQTITSMLAELREYTLSHFEYEEKVMRESNYPKLDNHILNHEILLKREEYLIKSNAELNFLFTPKMLQFLMYFSFFTF